MADPWFEESDEDWNWYDDEDWNWYDDEPEQAEEPKERPLSYEPEYATDPDIGVKCEWTGTLFTPIAGEHERIEASRKAEVTVKTKGLWVPIPVAQKDTPKRVSMDPLLAAKVRAK